MMTRSWVLLNGLCRKKDWDGNGVSLLVSESQKKLVDHSDDSDGELTNDHGRSLSKDTKSIATQTVAPEFIICSQYLRNIAALSKESRQQSRLLSTMVNPLVAVCQMTSIGDREKNFEIVKSLVIEAKERKACIAFFPEACDYLADNKKDIVALSEPLDGPAVAKYKDLALQHKIWLSLGGLHEQHPENPERVSNTHVLINNEGQLVAAYRKVHLFDMDNKDTGVRLMESDYVMAGKEIVAPVTTPVGKVGLSICYDMRFPELSLTLRNMGAEILTFPSAFTYQTGAAHWEVLLRARAIETQCYVIAAAQTGTHNKKRTSWGHAMIIDPWGTVVAQCSEKTGIAVAEIDANLLERVRKNMPCDNHRRTDLYPSMNFSS